MIGVYISGNHIRWGLIFGILQFILYDSNNSLLAISAASANMTSLSSKSIAKIIEKYKSENTKESILKGYNVYWLAPDTCSLKLKAKNLDVQEPRENEIDEPEKVEASESKKSSYFHTMYTAKSKSMVPRNSTSATRPHNTKYQIKRERRSPPTPEERLTTEEKEEKRIYDERNSKIAYAMSITHEIDQKFKIMVMDHVEGQYSRYYQSNLIIIWLF